MSSNRANLSKLSGLVLARTSLSEDQQEKPGPSGPETTKQVGGVPGSFDVEESTKNRERMRYAQRIARSRQLEDEKACIKEPNMHVRGPKGNKIYVSGPLLVSSNNVDKMLKEHDRGSKTCSASTT
ncbi:putative serine/threonine-protein kinase [Prunus yedoensis var. nudiflora]|uniref:Putative serine/threonine-protein kinase n=1 Tax=Prunus yedoensis var. nudiflora TaxID=2094558 RepID=A0A314XNT2_PRUYE|nr:putative serine/threonine-protein kinase [Prunus yedoensis var. nudiflora]